MDRRRFLSLFGGPIYLPFVNPGTQPIWEYTQVRLNLYLKGEPISTLNEMGQVGWELCSTVYDHSDTAIFFLKRKLE